MGLLRRTLAGFNALIRKSRVEQELEDELRECLEISIEEKTRAGMPREHAVRVAGLELGSLEAVKDHTRDVGWETKVESVWRDVRYALRMLRRSPAFAALAILTLGLGIGANVAVFTFVDAVLIQPLPFNEPDRLVMLSESHIESGQQRVGVLPGSFLDWRQRSRSFEAIALLWSGPFLITNRQEPARITGATVSPNFFELLGVAPVLGRTFPSSEAEAVGHEREIVISHGLWQRWFGADPQVLGRTLEVQGWVTLTIVGVMPPDFGLPRGAELWSHESWRSSGRGDRWRHAIGRMSAGVSIETAKRELEQISVQLAEEFPATNAGWTATAEPLADAIVGPVRPALAAMLAAVALVFLIACVNVATLVLLRGLRRQRELAMRAALGAGRNRLARQSLVEHAVLAAAGTITGGLLAVAILDGLVALAPTAIPRLETISMDMRVLTYLVLLALGTVAIIGAIPALKSSRVEMSAALKGDNAGRAPGMGGRFLVVAEVALAGVLLAGAGLMVRTIVNLQRVDLGFEPSGVVAADLMLPISRLTEGPARVGARPAWDRLAVFYSDVVEQIEAVPGVRRAAVVAAPSLAGREATWFARTGIVRPRADGSPEWRAIQRRVVTPGYFDVLRLPLVRGRGFNEQDNALEFLRSGTGRRRGVAIVNHVAAQQFWRGEDPLGAFLTIDGDSRVDGRVVVGIAGDARDLAPDIAPPPTVYVPFAETPDFSATLLARAADGVVPRADIRTRLRNGDPSLMIGEIRPLGDSYSATLAPRRFITIVLIAFAGFGLLLAGMGLYGLVAVSVAQRTRELGIRMALGARHSEILKLVLVQAVAITVIGIVIGLCGSAATARYLEGMLFGLTPLDATTLAAVSLLFGLVAAFASYWPARRAMKVDPLIAIRYE
jgi:putative ABC transport system permease protein